MLPKNRRCKLYNQTKTSVWKSSFIEITDEFESLERYFKLFKLSSEAIEEYGYSPEYYDLLTTSYGLYADIIESHLKVIKRILSALETQEASNKPQPGN